MLEVQVPGILAPRKEVAWETWFYLSFSFKKLYLNIVLLCRLKVKPSMDNVPSVEIDPLPKANKHKFSSSSHHRIKDKYIQNLMAL